MKIPAARLFNAYIRRWAAEGVLQEGGSLVWRADHSVRFTPQQQSQVERVMAKFAQSPYAPPTIKDVQAEVGEEVYGAMLDLGYLVAVSNEVAFRKQDYEAMIEMMRRHFDSHDSLTAAQFRDMLNTSRRYVLAFLEHLDAQGVTMREGDARKLRKSQNNR